MLKDNKLNGTVVMVQFGIDQARSPSTENIASVKPKIITKYKCTVLATRTPHPHVWDGYWKNETVLCSLFLLLPTVLKQE